MGADSKIEWCDHTFNPWIGCTKVSEGCAHCYAANSTRARVLRSRGQETWGKGAQRSRTSEANWKEPLRWNRAAEEDVDEALHDFGTDSYEPPPRPRVFCASLADWLDDEVPVEWLHRLLRLVFETRNLDWLLLTKRPQNWRGRILKCLILEEGGDPSDEWHFYNNDGLPLASEFAAWLNDWMGDMPPENVWVGTTCENQARADERVPELLKIPAKVRFLSCEPLLGAVDLSAHLSCYCPLECECKCPTIDWVIAGGESGPGARPMHPDWARSLRDQCAAAGVPFLFKQWGAFAPGFDEGRFTLGTEDKNRHVWLTRDGTQQGSFWIGDDDGHWHNWTGNPPHDRDGEVTEEVAVMHPCSKKEAGRLLDGKEHNGFPGVI